MSLRSDDSRFGRISLALHWVIVVGIIAQYLLAEAAEDKYGDSLIGLHRSVGLTILLLAVVRIAWRWFNTRPPWPQTMKGYERILARTAHVALPALPPSVVTTSQPQP